MIVEWFLGLVAGVADFFMDFIGTDDPPAFVTEIAPFVSSLIDSAQGLGVWIPWGVLIACAGSVAAFWLVVLVVKAARWLLGLVPTMGGGS